VWCRVGSDDELPDFDLDDADDVDNIDGASAGRGRPVDALPATTGGRPGASMAFAA
jgi:hypothetical protein